MGFAELIGAPWTQSDWPGWRQQLRGPPMKLLVICILQVLVLFIGLIIGIGKSECEVSIHGGSDIEINCNNCKTHPYVSWQQLVLLFVGLIVISLGVVAALWRSRKMCKIYGIIMMIYAFVIGLTSLLTGLDTIVLSSALEHIQDSVCKTFVSSMIGTSRMNAILYALNCILDCLGAIYAIKSKELFDFQEIANHHNEFQKSLLL
eukprot:TRINITY_DN7846_c0_g1_i2.p1 TRINITY_DN7846_c0_g1~~TRINITY_DN7846_c0_g1_i2.p1  ORF type:complete len:205 (-),score=30.13 TRINITY_DN7846_c0_g1_i2:110-724(-)